MEREFLIDVNRRTTSYYREPVRSGSAGANCDDDMREGVKQKPSSIICTDGCVR